MVAAFEQKITSVVKVAEMHQRLFSTLENELIRSGLV
jgi:hypothetical protein